jgi:serine/threonine protein kinase
VAVKRLKVQELELSETAREDFVREVDNMERLRSPYIVNFYGVVLMPGNIAMVTEFCELGSLGQVIKHHNLPINLRIKMLLDSAKGLNFLHKFNMLHRDFKPDNVLVFSLSVEAPVCCKLTDFGTSCTTTSKKKDLLLTKGVGTPAYMAPEVISSESYSKAADVYSYAMVLWEIWSGKSPFMEGNFKSLYAVSSFTVSSQRLPLPEGCPPWYGQLITRCWAQNPQSRPAVDAIVAELESHRGEGSAPVSNRQAFNQTGPVSAMSPASTAPSKVPYVAPAPAPAPAGTGKVFTEDDF